MAKAMIETRRLVLRPMQATDVDQLLAIFADPLVMVAFDTPPFDRVQMMQWVQRNLDHQSLYGYGLFSIVLKSNGVLIGDCGLEQMELGDKQAAELGYDFRSDYWNLGYATEAASAVRDYAFHQLQLPEVVSLIHQSNGASQRVATRIGMQRVEALIRFGKPYWLYQLRRGEVILRDVTEADLAIFFEHQLDPAATALAAFAARDRNTFMAHWIKILGDDSIAKQSILYDGKVVGNIVCFDHEGKREVGYWLGKEYWGKGIATQALSAFLRQVAARPLYAYVANHNLASRRVLEKCGFMVVGEDTTVLNTGSETGSGSMLKLELAGRGDSDD